MQSRPSRFFKSSSALGVAVALMLSAQGCAINMATGADTNSFASSKATADNSPAAIGARVAQWQLDAFDDLSYLDIKVPESSYDRGWVKGAFFVGLDRFARATNDKALFVTLRQESLNNGFEVGERYWHGDDQTMVAVYAHVAKRDGKPEYLRPAEKIFTKIIDANYKNSLEFIEPKPGQEGAEGTCQVRWCWADAIFMAPPAWALTTNVTGDARYLDYAVKESIATLDYLFDDETDLAYRDSRYFDLRTTNGEKVMWSRGNGWVFAGLARLIEAMPQDHSDRAYFVDIYKRMAAALIQIQREDGYWPTSLLDAAILTNPETSGTGFFGFGLAWGLNNGFLEGDDYVVARDKAWSAMTAAVNDDGRLGWVQQIGKDPQTTTADTSQLYGSGAFLLFASEMIAAE
jgi:rhamnogalacturonyl hydrolase YesR